MSYAGKLKIDAVRLAAEAGHTVVEIAEKFKVRPESAQRFCRQNDISGPNIRFGMRDWRDSPVSQSTEPCNTPPSLAMIRLAQFDPVIARALAMRIGASNGS